MSSFSDLPTELATDILAIAIPQHPVPGSILAVNRCFNDIGQFIIYTSLRFKSESQLVKFALKRRFRLHHNRGHHPHRSHHRQKGGCWGRNSDPALTVSATFSGGACKICGSGTSDTVDKKILPHFPRSISVRIPGGHGGGIVFEGIKHVFQFCADAVGAGVLALDSLEFCLNSHARDLAPWRIGEALSLVNPRQFVWTGPGSPYHFYTAIVPCATYHLFQSIKSWSNLQSLTLTNIAFPSNNTFVPIGSSEVHHTFCILANANETLSPLGTLTNLRRVYIGQATLVPMRSIAKLVLARPNPNPPICSGGVKDVWYREREAERGDSGLKEVRLVDAYKESDWIDRIRRKDLETVAMEFASSATHFDSLYHAPTGEVDSDAVLDRIREIVSCEGPTGRIESMSTLI